MAAVQQGAACRQVAVQGRAQHSCALALQERTRYIGVDAVQGHVLKDVLVFEQHIRVQGRRIQHVFKDVEYNIFVYSKNTT